MAVTIAELRRMALALGPEIEEGTSYGTLAFKTKGKLFVRLREDNDSLAVGTTFEEREELVAADPDTYYFTDHYANYPYVLVRLSRVHPDALRDLLGRAQRLASAAATPKPRRKRVR